MEYHPSVGLWAYAFYTLGSCCWYFWYLGVLQHQMREAGGRLEQAKVLKPVKRLRMFSFACFLVSIFTATRGIDLSPQFWMTLAWVYACFLLDSAASYRVIRFVRHLHASTFESLKLTVRQLAAFAFLYTTYLFVLAVVAVGVTFSVKLLHLDEESTKKLAQLGTPLGVFFGLVTTFSLSPYFIRIMFPSSPVLPDQMYGNLQGAEFSKSVIEAFKLAHFEEPKIRILELDRFKIHNAMITGFRKKRFGIGGPTVYFTKSLLKELETDELEAVIKHEVSHLVLNHLKKRLYFSFLMVMASYLPVTGVVSLVQWLMPTLGKGYLSLTAVVVALAFQIFTLRIQVRRQEYEADAYAVKGLQASANALYRALLKLDRLNHQNSRRKDPWSYLNPSSAHPTTIERGLALGQTEKPSKVA